jgi:glutathione S-transferase
MALTFYYGSGSPFAWRVFLALEYKRIPYTLRVLSFSQRENKTPEYLAINPRGKVPAIVDDDFALYESSAILEYLDDRFTDGPRLFPSGLRDRAIVRRLINEVDLYLGRPIDDMALQIYFKKPDDWDGRVLDAGRRDTLEELARLEAIAKQPFLAGQLSAADFVLYPFLATQRRLELRKSDLGLVAAVGPKLAAIARGVEALPYFEKTIPPHWK